MKDTARLAVATGTGAVAAGTARGAYAALRRYPPAGDKTWSRTNHRGEPVTLLEGPAVTAGAVAAAVVTAAVASRHPERQRVVTGSLAVAGLGGLAFGVLDDLRGSAERRGLRGHLGALAHGEVTTGAVKLAGLAAAGVAAALLEGGEPADVAVNAGLIAGGANLLNLFDLRPGRAIKVAALSAALIASGGILTPRPAPSPLNGTARPYRGTGRLAGLEAVAAPAGAALALLPEDLGERAMLGDAGANALGAMLGAAAARTLPRSARAGLLAAIVALTVASEKVSFTKVIAATAPLNWLDMLGRRPAPPAPLAAPVPGDTASGDTASGDTASGDTVPGDTASGDTALRGLALAGLVPVQARRRQPGRHRRTDTRESRTRSGSVFSVFRKAVLRTLGSARSRARRES